MPCLSSALPDKGDPSFNHATTGIGLPIATQVNMTVSPNKILSRTSPYMETAGGIPTRKEYHKIKVKSLHGKDLKKRHFEVVVITCEHVSPVVQIGQFVWLQVQAVLS